VTFLHDGSETTTASFDVSVEDGDEDGSSPTASKFTFTVNPVNDAPVNTVSATTRVTDEDTDLAITGLSFSDPDATAPPTTVTLTVLHGTLTVRTDVPGGSTHLKSPATARIRSRSRARLIPST